MIHQQPTAVERVYYALCFVSDGKAVLSETSRFFIEEIIS
jgi:hypothetical protein